MGLEGCKKVKNCSFYLDFFSTCGKIKNWLVNYINLLAIKFAI